MERDKKIYSVSGTITTILVLINAIILREALITNEDLYWALTLSIPLLAIAVLNWRLKEDQSAVNRFHTTNNNGIKKDKKVFY